MDNQNNGSLKTSVIQAVKEHPDLTYAEIAELLDVKPHQVAVWANQGGIFRRRKLTSPSSPQEDSLDEKLRQAEQQVAELKRLKALTEIRFEREGSKVAVYGLGAQPIFAEYKDWLRFLRNNGATKLREFIQAEFGAVNGNGSIQ